MQPEILFCVLSFNKRFQAGETRLPKHSIFVEPGINRPERRRIQPVHALPAHPALFYQMPASQQTQVFRNGRTGDRKDSGNLTGGPASLPQQVKHGPAGGVGESTEGSLPGIRN